jgi:triphosphoribosyl-dephospho-CoA synthase
MSVQWMSQSAVRAVPVDTPCLWLRSVADTLADRAVDALVTEALLTPKPALVDGRGSGAHHDLTLDLLLRSALSLRDSFRQMAECAADRGPSVSLREDLAQLGRAAEQRMLAATGGSNAHRGAIWVLGLLVAASASRDLAGDQARIAGDAGAIAATAAAIARFPDRFAPLSSINGSINGPSNGSSVCARYGVGGARGEARSGFPHVVKVGLPALQSARRRGVAELHARLDALMAIMTSLDDTCLLHRGGRAALEAAQNGARTVLHHGGTSIAAGWQALLALDAKLLGRWVSPGGCADLLAACFFLDNETERVQGSSLWSE